MDSLTDLNSHHTTEHVEHLVFVGVDVEVGPSREGRQPDLRQSHKPIGLTAGHANEGTESTRRQVRVPLARCQDKRSADSALQG